MAHFAKLDQNNQVIDVNVVSNEDIQHLDFPQSEVIGIAFLTQWSRGYTNWRQTSYNARFRKNYAAIGGYFDPVRDAFIPAKLYNSWVLDENTCTWQAPVPYPWDGYPYVWNETTLSWDRVQPDYPSWIFDEDGHTYVPPVPYPQDGKKYQWDEAIEDWLLLE